MYDFVGNLVLPHILEIAYSKSLSIGYFAYYLGSLAAFLTSFYSVRLLYLTFITKTNAYQPYIRDYVFKLLIASNHECGYFIGIPLFIVCF